MDMMWQRRSITNLLISVPAGFKFAGIVFSMFSSRNDANELYIDGNQDIDADWIEEVKSNCGEHCPYIVPRYVWEADSLVWTVFLGK